MKKIKYKDEEYDLEEKDFFLIEAINSLTAELFKMRISK